jgi:hypothetical protein
MARPTTPNIDLPIRFDGTDFALNEMDSASDFKTKAEVLMRYRPGDRSDLPEFGGPGLVGKLAPLDLADVQRALGQWIPEGNYRVTESGNPGDPAERRVVIEVDEPSVDQ